MKTFFTIHQTPGMTADQFKEGAEQFTPTEGVELVHLYVNFRPGKIVAVYRAETEAQIIDTLETAGWPYEGIFETNFEIDPSQWSAKS